MLQECKTVLDVHFPGVNQSSISLESAARAIKILDDAAENSSGREVLIVEDHSITGFPNVPEGDEHDIHSHLGGEKQF